MVLSDSPGSAVDRRLAPGLPASRATAGLVMAILTLLATAGCGGRGRPAQPGGEAPPAAVEAGTHESTDAQAHTDNPAPLVLADDPSPPPETHDQEAGDSKLGLCGDLQPSLARALGLDPAAFALRPADVVFPEWGNLLDGCRLSWEGPGLALRWEEGSSQLPTTRAIRGLIDAGWEEDKAHSEDRPGGFARIYVQGLRLCRLDVAFTPPPGQACAGQDPVTCGLGPAQLDYRIALSCAED